MKRIFIPLVFLIMACGSTTVSTTPNLPRYQELVCSNSLSRWLDQSSERHIVQLVRMDKQKTSDINLFLTTAKNQGVDMGRLIQPQPNAPFSWLLLETGGTRFIAGWINTSVSGKPVYITFSSPSASRDKAVAVNQRCFVMPILSQEYDAWSQISKISIQTEESLRDGLANFQASGNAWESQWSSPLDISNQFMYVP